MENMSIYSAEMQTAAAQSLTAAVMQDFVDFIDRSEKTARTYIVNLRQFFAWLAYTGIYSNGSARPTRNDIINYRDWLATEHDAIQLDVASAAGWRQRTRNGCTVRVACRPNTIKLYLQSVRQFFSWTAASGIYPNVAANIHAPKIKADTHKRGRLTIEQVGTIEQSIIARSHERQDTAAAAIKDTAGRMQRSTEQSKRLYAMYVLAVNAGLRTIEISRANVRDIETVNGVTYMYIYGKGHSEADQKKPLAPEVAAAIADYLRSRSDAPTGNSPLFVSTGNRSRGQRIAATTISTMLKQAMRDAGIESERLTAHSLRHTAGDTVRQLTGDNIYLTQQYMRHADPKTTEIYLHTNEEDNGKQADIAQRLYNAYHSINADADSRSTLDSIITGMSAAQIEQLTLIAQAMQK